jgi:hypothetical protein
MLTALGVCIQIYKRPSLPRIEPWLPACQLATLTTRPNPRPDVHLSFNVIEFVAGFCTPGICNVQARELSENSDFRDFCFHFRENLAGFSSECLCFPFQRFFNLLIEFSEFFSTLFSPLNVHFCTLSSETLLSCRRRTSSSLNPSETSAKPERRRRHWQTMQGRLVGWFGYCFTPTDTEEC